ncbi:hypothetical protein ABGV40_14775 [Paenibacillus amylolyticus]|uniref:hypothetical protein n=1 Tax=Paenibacillus amylolyticus TaxID=1451 RepID=UPI0032427260
MYIVVGDTGRIVDAIKNLAETLGIAFETVANAVGFRDSVVSATSEMLMKEYEEMMMGYEDLYIEDEPPFKFAVPYFKIISRMPKQTHFPKIRATARSTC